MSQPVRDVPKIIESPDIWPVLPQIGPSPLQAVVTVQRTGWDKCSPPTYLLFITIVIFYYVVFIDKYMYQHVHKRVGYDLRVIPS